MNEHLFADMQAQMTPSHQAREQLRERLDASAPAKRRPEWLKYGMLAACAALILALPLSRLFSPAQVLHSYSFAAGAAMSENTAEIGQIPSDSGGGANTETEDIPADANGQGVYHHQNLTAHFEAEYGPDTWPQWYGGSYLNGRNQLVVQIVEEFEPEDKDLFLQIQEWAGGGDVAFGSAKYSLSHLRQLQNQAFEEMSRLGLAVGCGVDEEANQVKLLLSDVTDRALAILARLDPGDDALQVLVSQAAVADDGPANSHRADAEEPVSHPAVQPAGDPAGYTDRDGDPIAYEPTDPGGEGTDMEEPQLAHYDLLEIPGGAQGADVPSYDPQA